MKALRALLASMLGAALENHPIWFIPSSRASCDRKTEPNVTVMTLSCVATLSQGVFSPRDTIWRDKLGWFCVWGEFRGSKNQNFSRKARKFVDFFSTATPGEEFSAVLHASPDVPFSIDATTKFTTNMESPSSFAATYGKA